MATGYWYDLDPAGNQILVDPTVLTSYDGKTWLPLIPQSIGSDPLFFGSLIYYDGRFITAAGMAEEHGGPSDPDYWAVSYHLITASADGNTWLTLDSGKNDFTLWGIAHSNDLFFAVGGVSLFRPPTTSVILGSPDGVIWSTPALVPGPDLSAIAFGHDTFVAIGSAWDNNPAATPYILTLGSVGRWVERYKGSPGDPLLSAIAFGNSRFVVVGDNGTILTCSLPLLGLDVSHYQGQLDLNSWGQISQAGKQFVYVKASEGLQGENLSDPSTTIANANNASQSGLLVGVYHLAHPKLNLAIDEAFNFRDRGGQFIGMGYLPPALNLETHDQNLTDGAFLYEWVREWLWEVEFLTGVRPIIYATMSDWTDLLPPSLGTYGKWIATYVSNPNNDPLWLPTVPGTATAFYEWEFQQYRDGTTGRCPGITSANGVDLDSFNGTIDDLRAMTLHTIVPRFAGIGGGPVQPPDGNGVFSMQVSFPGVQQVTIQASEDLQTWIDVMTVQLNQGLGVFVDLTAGSHRTRFYRVKP